MYLYDRNRIGGLQDIKGGIQELGGKDDELFKTKTNTITRMIVIPHFYMCSHSMGRLAFCLWKTNFLNNGVVTYFYFIF